MGTQLIVNVMHFYEKGIGNGWGSRDFNTAKYTSMRHAFDHIRVLPSQRKLVTWLPTWFAGGLSILTGSSYFSVLKNSKHLRTL